MGCKKYGTTNLQILTDEELAERWESMPANNTWYIRLKRFLSKLFYKARTKTVGD